MAISGKHPKKIMIKNQAENMNSLKRLECGRDSYTKVKWRLVGRPEYGRDSYISYIIDM